MVSILSTLLSFPRGVQLYALILCAMCFSLSPLHAQGVDTRVVDSGTHPIYRFPDTVSPIDYWMQPNSEMRLIGQYLDGTWLQVESIYGETGWMQAESIVLDVDLTALPEIDISADMVLDNTYYWNITPYTRGIFLYGQELGNRIDYFSKVGDSITVNQAFLTPFGKNIHSLQEYGYLGIVIDYFNQVGTFNAFRATSNAAETSWTTRDVLQIVRNDRLGCRNFETRLECEYRLERPMLALIMLGTNDVHGVPLQEYEANLREIVEISIEHGVIPVLSTIPPQLGWDFQVRQYNRVIVNVAGLYQVPLWNYWLAMTELPSLGLSFDGVHPSSPPDGAHTTNFTPEFLQYGYTKRNLMALEILHLLLFRVIYA